MAQQVKISRKCGSCTKCCEGWLSGEVDNEKFYKGVPCKFCVTNSGCGNYNNRPDDPCKTFKCSWLSDDSLPEWAKPELCGAIIYERTIGGMTCGFLVPTGQDVSITTLSWFLIWSLNKYQNAVWYNSFGSEFYLGPKELGEVLNKLN